MYIGQLGVNERGKKEGVEIKRKGGGASVLSEGKPGCRNNQKEVHLEVVPPLMST